MMEEKNKNMFSSTATSQKNVDMTRYLDTIFNNTLDPIFVKNSNCELLLVNDAFCHMFELPREKIIGKTLGESVPAHERDHFFAVDKKVLSDGKEFTCEESLSPKGTTPKIVVTKKNRFEDDEGNFFLVGVVHDITEQKKIELREKARGQVLELLANGEHLSEVLNSIVNFVEQHSQAMRCSVLILDDMGKHLEVCTSSRLPDFYNEAINGIEIGMGVGSCGTAAFLNERIIAENIKTHPYWEDHKAIAEKAGLGSCWSEPIRSSKGGVLGTFAIYHHDAHYPSDDDLTIIEQAASLASIAIENKLAKEKLTRAASVFNHAHESILITDANGDITEVNDTFSQTTGYSAADILGKNVRVLQSGMHSAEFYRDMWDSLLTKGHWRGEIWNRRKSGDIYAALVTISAAKNSGDPVQHYVSLSTDITPMKAYQRQLERVAHYDPLTNLPNRVLLAEQLKHSMELCIEHNYQLAVAYMDIDGFKSVNDTYGHNVGDELLIAVSHRMNSALRQEDSLARIGGDEFIAIMVGLDSIHDSKVVLDRLLAAASDPVYIGANVMQVSSSIGVTLYPQDGVNADQLIRHADQAMYIAKQGGKNRYHYFDTARENATKTAHQSMLDVRQAIKSNEFVLHYQPKINMRTGEVIGVEALIRWQHPSRGLIAPLDFLPSIENQPISLELGEWVISTALKQMNSWQLVGINLPISVNVSAYQLQQPNFTGRLAKLLGSHTNVAPNSLELEVLETSVLNDINQVSATMTACHQLGVHFALDDFGTGYSSLTHLRHLPAHIVKIDQSFVRDMLDDADDLAIVEGVIGLSKAFQRDVIAEGVETVAHGSALLKLSCQLAQGYGIAQPMPAEEIPNWLANWQVSDSWKAQSVK